MRKKRFWKVLGLSVSAVLILMLLFVVGFVFNPFEGSLPDMRDAVPRDVDFFVRKTDLVDDFPDFPEPRFWEEFALSQSWNTLQQGPLYRGIQQDLQADRVLGEIRASLQQVRDNSWGLLDPVGDTIGSEIILAGRLGGRPTDQAQWCVYTRVSWKVRAAWGLKNIGVLQSALASGGIQVQDQAGMLTLRMPGNPQPIHVARFLDCVMISNDEVLLRDSLALAEGIGGGEPFGRSSFYQDGITRPIETWEDLTNPLETNALEFYLRPQNLRDFQVLQDSWPDSQNPDSMNERVLASFVNLNVWRFLTGSLLFEDDSLSVLSRIELNRNAHTSFQQEFFKSEPQDRGQWLDPFLRMVPQNACACAALRMPAEDFLHEMFRSLDRTDQTLLDEGIRKTGKYRNVRELIDKVAFALLPRTGFVFRKNLPDPDIPVLATSPVPQIAWVFWVKPGMKQPLEDLEEVMRLHHRTFGFESAYELRVNPGVEDKILEFTNRQIPGTGEVAMILFDRFFVVSNSGPLIRALFDNYFGEGRGSILQGQYMEIFDRELPNAVNGFIYLQGRQLEEVLADYEKDIDFVANLAPDPDWMVRNRPSVEDLVRRQKYPQYGSIRAIPPNRLAQFHEDVDAHLRELWTGNSSRYTAADRESLRQAKAVSRLFSAAYLQVMLEPEYINLTGRVLLEYRNNR